MRRCICGLLSAILECKEYTVHFSAAIMPEVPCMKQDGRDVPDGTSVKFVEQLEKDLAALDGVDAKIASGGGRMAVTMDRYEVLPLSYIPLHRCRMFPSTSQGCSQATQVSVIFLLHVCELLGHPCAACFSA